MFGRPVGVFFLLAWLSGCGSDDTESSFCERYCGRVRECGGSASCPQSCASYQASTILNTDFLQAIAPCMARSSCADVLSGDYHGKCYEEAVAALEPGAEVVESCAEIVRSDYACGYRADHGECVQSATALKPSVVERMKACAREETCDLLEACYERLFP